MGSLPIMAIFGDHNEAKRVTATAAMTRFPLLLLQDVSFILLGTFSAISFQEKQETCSFL